MADVAIVASCQKFEMGYASNSRKCHSASGAHGGAKRANPARIMRCRRPKSGQILPALARIGPHQRCLVKEEKLVEVHDMLPGL
jgi:hypothetical protein